MFVPVVSVIESHDIVLSQVGAGLDFDNLQRDAAGIFQAVLLANWHMRRIVFVEIRHFVACRHFGRSPHDNPVFGAVVVHLERERGARVDC